MASFGSILIYTAIPVAATCAGGVLAALIRFGPRLTSTVQHFAAGVVFAAAGSELLPDVLHARAALPAIIGAAAALAVMLLIKRLEGKTSGLTGFLAIVGIDIFVDGLVLGIGFVGGQKQGLLLTVALTLEVLFLGLSLAEPLRQANASSWRIVGMASALALALPLGAAIGVPLGSISEPIRTGLFAFGLIALLYLVTEELLVEAHGREDIPFVTAMFFVGFMLLVMLEQQIG